MQRLFRRVLPLVSASLMLFLPLAAEAAKKSPGCLTGNCAPGTEETLDPQAQMLIGELARHPELMNLEYLRFHIGLPENEKREHHSLNHDYLWYGEHRQLRYQLQQTQRTPGVVTEAIMTVRLDGMGMTFDRLEHLYGQPTQKFFDNNGHPSELFSLSPNTNLSFSSAPNSFRVNQAKITYRGAPLPPPSAEDMSNAESRLLAQSALAGAGRGTSVETIPLLEARLKVRPLDAESHLLLARALQRQSRLHEAIGEYKIALGMSGDNAAVRNAALDALRAMHIIDDPANEAPQRDLKFVQHGQRLRAHGTKQEALQSQ